MSRAPRAVCAYCDHEQAVKKDGTLWKHTVYIGWQHRVCPGTGKTPEEAAKGWGKQES